MTEFLGHYKTAIRFLLCSVLTSTTFAAAENKPNIIFILTDDQDLHMDSLQHMPLLQKYLVNEGTSYVNHYCTTAVCCPSRATLWTGRLPHNTNVTDVTTPYGGYPKIVSEGLNDNYLPIWMQDAGYNTYYTGKLYNQHTVTNYNKPLAKGYNTSDFLLDPYTYDYFNSKLSRNGAPPVSYAGSYSPDVIFDKTLGFIEEATKDSRPWFITAAPIAPHSRINGDTTREGTDPNGQQANFFEIPQYAARHAHLFENYTIPRTANFNPEIQGGVSWIKNLSRLNSSVIASNDEWQRARLRSLQAVDEGVEKIIKLLEAKNALEKTYIIFSTDNGFHISQHRMLPGKSCGYETDIHIPLIIRGPGIPAGGVSEAITSHTDLAPTILGLAGHSRAEFDGIPLPIIGKGNPVERWAEHANVEFWGSTVAEGSNYPLDPLLKRNTYKALRLVGKDFSLYYSVWCTNEKEYYDMKLDPGQLHNLFDAPLTEQKIYKLFNRPFKQLLQRLDALLMVLKKCKGAVCKAPWRVLHPQGDVNTLAQALDAQFDVFYSKQPKVAFNRCEQGYLLDAEGPQEVVPFAEDERPELQNN